MTPNEFEAYWNDCLQQKAYDIYDADGELLGLFNGHDADHAMSKYAQYEECDSTTLSAKRAWPDSND